MSRQLFERVLNLWSHDPQQENRLIAKFVTPVLFLATAFSSSAQAADNFSGNWTGPKNDGGYAITCSFSLKGKELSGSCHQPMQAGSMSGPVSGGVEGRNVTWTWMVQGAGIPIAMQFSGQWDLKNAVTVQRTYKDVPAGYLMPGPKSFTFTRTPAK